jgi:N-acetylglutamate synthase-like GNAT family acetyltransferase
MTRSSGSGVRVERATAADHDAVLALLAANGLPLAGAVEHLGTAVVVRLDSDVIGCAALELYEHGALLRSVAVRGDAQGAGVGHALVEAALSLATELQADFVYLLTTTAQRFFPRFGFEVIARDEVPATVRQSVEFRSACPASAVVMRSPQR